ncbi:MAG: GGDEF domain-containing protein [Alphaproteobacteria bacterium]|nr:GGDEF domain-containing protein [Alphaproteobacteria bacterium]
MPSHALFFVILASSVFLQLTAAVLALCAIPYSRRYRYPWILLSLALLVMVERRAVPLYDVLRGGEPDLLNELFGLLISFLMAGSQIGLRRLLLAVRDKEEQLIRLADTDSLTGLANRSHALARLKSEIIRAERSGSPLSVLILDIDYFKRVNDQYGHVAGDEVLVATTARCAEQLRAIDIFGRLGGEEFLIVLPETDAENAAYAAERLRAVCADTPIVTSQGQFAITISIGVTTHRPPQPSSSGSAPATNPEAVMKSLLQRADHALYQAKAKGRNCVREWR